MSVEEKLADVYLMDEEAGEASPEEIKVYLARQKEALFDVYKGMATSNPSKVSDGEGDSQKEKYDVVTASNYALGARKLKGQRPVFSGNLKARLEDPALYDAFLDSFTGIAYDGNGRFRIKDNPKELLEIPKNFSGRKSKTEYESFGGVELCIKDAKYNTPLTENEVLEHPAWIAAVNGDKELLGRYARNWFNRTGRQKGMGFYVDESAEKGDLRALVINSDNYSNASGDNYLNSNARFVRDSPK